MSRLIGRRGAVGFVFMISLPPVKNGINGGAAPHMSLSWDCLNLCSFNKVLWLQIRAANDLKSLLATVHLLNCGGAQRKEFLL